MIVLKQRFWSVYKGNPLFPLTFFHFLYLLTVFDYFKEIYFFWASCSFSFFSGESLGSMR